MQVIITPSPRRGLKAALVGAAAALLSVSASAQIAYTQDFNAGAGGWSGSSWSQYANSTACGGTGGAMRKNLYGSVPTGQLTSPSLGSSLGGAMAISFDYKVCDWSANTVGTLAPFGTIAVQYAASASGPWTTIGSFTDEVQSGSCIPKSFNFAPPAGPLFVRFDCTRSAGTSDSYWNFDNVIVMETVSPCVGTPAPGDTTGPSVVCSGENLVLGLQNSTVGAGVSYQWYVSTVSNSGPWSPVGSGGPTLATTQAATSWYYCDVTCSAGPSTGSSNVKQVDLGNVFPQTFGSGVVAPNCWSVSSLVGTSLPDYQTPSAFGVGTGSVRFNFYNISLGNEPILTSPDFAPVAAGTEIYFDVAGATYTGGEIDTVTIEESNDGGANWTAVAVMTNEPGVGVLNTIGGTGTQSSNLVPTANQWGSLIYTLSAGTNKVRFHGLSGFGNSVFFDNISVGVMPSARHTKYGKSCGSPVSTLSSATPPISGTTTVYDLGSIPLACPAPDPVFYFGFILVSIGGQDFAGTDLLTGYGVDAPGCSLHVTSADLVLGYVDTVDTQTVNLDIPALTPAGFLFYSQAAALICPVAPNNAGVILSNGLRSYVNSF